MRDKRLLIRVAPDKDGGISVDRTGKRPGRGAYVCRDAACIDRAAARKGFERSFKKSVPKEVYEKLKNELADINLLGE